MKVIKLVLSMIIVLLLMSHPVFDQIFFYEPASKIVKECERFVKEKLDDFLEDNVSSYDNISEIPDKKDTVKEIDDHAKDNSPVEEIARKDIGKKYYYEQLSENNKYLYDSLFHQFIQLQDLVSLEMSEELYLDLRDDVNHVLRAISLDNPTVLNRLYIDKEILRTRFDPSSETPITIAFDMDDDLNTISMYNEIAIENIRKIVAENAIYDDLTKIENYYYWLTNNVVYDINGTHNRIHSIVGPMFDQVAVCDGIAKSFKSMCDFSGIPCLVVVSDTHAWNIVVIDNEIYHLDATWDLGKDDWKFFMLSYDDLLLLDNVDHNISYKVDLSSLID